MRYLHSLCALLVLASFHAASAADSADDLLEQARAALKNKMVPQALALLDKAIAADPKHAKSLLLRGSIREVSEEHDKAIADFDKVIALDPKSAEAFNRRGSERLKIGRIAAALADFDRFLELRPDQAPGHWQRGIALYYAGKYDEGAKQFQGYEKVDTNDVENAVWHFLCVARKSGIEKGRAALLKIGKDKRVPMMEVYSLFAGKAKADDVLAAVQEGKPSPEELNRRLFYAHLYLGLYFDAAGEPKKALDHMTKAADDHRLPDYMWSIARVHRDLLRKDKKKE